MTTTGCPNCGKPLRPGARFCGSCGHILSTPAPAQARSAPASPPAAVSCPQCGKPVRAGAKFCSNCGKVLQAEAPPAPPEEKPAFVPPEMVAKPAVPSQPAPAPVARPAAPPPAKAGTDRRTKQVSKMIWPGLLIGLALVCGLGGGAGYIYFKDPFGWLGKSVATATIPAPNQTPTPAVTVTATRIQLPTQNPPTLTLNAPVEPVLTATSALSPTVQVSPATPVSNTTPAASGVILLNDNFTDPLNLNWKSWGSPRPVIRSGPGRNWLELTAIEQPAKAGVTSRQEIANAPGTVIQFEGQVNPGYVNYPLFFDWDPLQFDRGPENTDLTVLHLEIHNTRIVLQAPAANNTCQKEFDGAKQHSYELKFTGEKKVVLRIDNGDPAFCELDLGIKPTPGRITFTGTGWVARILVTTVNQP